jgi:integrase
MSRRSSEGTVYRRNSDGRWVASWVDITGRRRQVYRRTRAEARTALRTALAERDAGHGGADVTLADWLARWRDGRNLRATSAADLDYRLTLIPDWLTRLTLAELTPAHIDTALRELADTPTVRGTRRSPSTVAKVRTTLVQALDQAVRWGQLGRNVARMVDPPAQDPPQIVPLTLTEARSLLRQVEGHRYEAGYLLAIACGLRRGEVLGLRWCDVNLEQATATIVQQVTRTNRCDMVIGPPKTRSSLRTVSLPDVVVDGLRRRRRQWAAERIAGGELWQYTDLIFGNQLGMPTWPDNLLRHLRRACDDAGIRRVSFHTLRHSAGTLLLAAGVDSRVVMQILGHSTPQMAVRYQHVVRELETDAAGRMDGLLGGSAAVLGAVNEEPPRTDSGG